MSMMTWSRVGGVVLAGSAFLAWNLGLFSGRGAAPVEAGAQPSTSPGTQVEESVPSNPGPQVPKSPSRTLKQPPKPGAGKAASPQPPKVPASRPAKKKALAVLLKELAAKGVHLDLKKKLAWVSGRTWMTTRFFP